MCRGVDGAGGPDSEKPEERRLVDCPAPLCGESRAFTSNKKRGRYILYDETRRQIFIVFAAVYLFVSLNLDLEVRK